MTTESRNPSVIFVHGAFADASSWARVLERVRGAGFAAEAIPNPLRGLTFAGEYVASVLAQVDGPGTYVEVGETTTFLTSAM